MPRLFRPGQLRAVAVNHFSVERFCCKVVRNHMRRNGVHKFFFLALSWAAASAAVAKLLGTTEQEP